MSRRVGRLEIKGCNGMAEYRLRIGRFTNLGNGIIESVVDQGVEVDVSDIQELITLLGTLQPRPRALLADRRNSYSFTFAALQFASSSDALEAVAEVNYGHRPLQIVGNLLMPKFFKFAMFARREEALQWLQQRLGDDLNPR